MPELAWVTSEQHWSYWEAAMDWIINKHYLPSINIPSITFSFSLQIKKAEQKQCCDSWHPFQKICEINSAPRRAAWQQLGLHKSLWKYERYLIFEKLFINFKNTALQLTFSQVLIHMSSYTQAISEARTSAGPLIPCKWTWFTCKLSILEEFCLWMVIESIENKLYNHMFYMHHSV